MATSKRSLFFWSGLTVLFLGVFFFSQTAHADTTSSLYPTADGSQDSVRWQNQSSTSCSSTTCYTSIDETVANDGTDYIKNPSFEGFTMSFDIDESSIPDDSTVTGMQIYFRAIRVDTAGGGGGEARTPDKKQISLIESAQAAVNTASVSSVRCFDGSCTTYGSAQSLTTSWTSYSQNHTGLSYTKTSGSDIEIGVVGSGYTDAYGQVTQMYVVITYTPPVSGITISGNIYTDEGSTAYNCSSSNKTVQIKVAGAGSFSGTCTASSGAYSVAGVTGVSSGVVITAYIDNGSILGNTVSIANSAVDITGFNIYQNRVNLRHENAGPVTNTTLDAFDNNNDADMLYTVTSGTYTGESSTKLVVLSGETYTPGGAVNTPTLEVIGTFNAGTYTHTLSGSGTGTTCTAASGTVMPLCISGTFNANTSKMVFSGSSATTVENATYYNLDIGGSATTATYTLDGNSTVSNVLTIVSSSGTNTFSLSSYTLTLSGSGTPLVNNETFTASTGKVAYTGSSATNVVAVTYYNLDIGGSGTTATYTAAGNFTVSNVLAIATSSGTNTFSGSTRTVTLSGSGTPFVINSNEVFSASSSTIVYTGSSSTNITSATYWDLQTNGSGTYTAVGTITVSNDIFLTAGAFDLSASNYALNVTGNFNFDGGTFNMRGSTITVSGNWDSTVSTDQDGQSVTIGTATVVMNGSGTKTILTGGNSVWQSRFYNLNIAQGTGKTTQLLQTFGVKNITTIGAGTLNLNSKYIYLGNGASSSNANPLSIDPSATVGTGNGYLLFFGATMTQYAPSFNYNTNLGIQASNNTTKQTGNITAVGMLVSCCTNRVGTWDTNGYNLTLSGTMTIDNYNATLTLGTSTVTVGTNWNNPNTGTAPGTVNYGTSNVVFNSTATGRTIKGATSTPEFYNLTFNGSGGAWSFSTTSTIANDLTVTAGTLSGTNDLTVQGGDVTGNGTINLTGGIFYLYGTGNFGGSTAWTFNSIQFGDATTDTTTAIGSGGITVARALTIYPGQTLNAGGKTWTLSNSVDDTSFTNSGTFTASTSTVNYTGTSGGSSASVYPATYYNLGVGTTVDSNAVTYNMVTSDFTVSNQLTVGNASSGNSDTFNVNGRTLTLSKSGTGASAPLIITSKGAISDTGSGTVNYTGADNTEIAAGTYNILKIHGTALKTYTLGTASSQTITASTLYLYAPTSGASNITYTATTYNPTVNISSSLQLNACQEVCGTGDANLSAGSGTWTLSGSGTPFVIVDDGGFTPDTSTFAYTHGTSATTTAATYYNLSFTGGGTYTLPVNTTTTASNDITISSGTLAGTGNIYAESMVGNGTVNLTGGTVTLANSTNSFGGSSAWTLNNLIISTTKNATGSGGIAITGTLTIGGGGILNAGSKTWTLSGSGTPLIVSGTLNPETSRFSYTGSSATNVTGTSYYDVWIGGSGTTATYTAAGNITVGGNLLIATSTGTNTFAGSSRTITLTGGGHPFTVASNEVFSPGTGTVSYIATSSVTLGTTYYNLSVGTSSDAVATTYTLGADTTVQNTVTVGNAASSAMDTLNGGSYTFVIEGTGTPMNMTSKGLFNGGSGTVRYTGNGETEIASSTYNNLQIIPSTGPNKNHIFGTASGQTIVINGNLDLALDNSSAVVEASTYNPNIIVKGNVTVGACIDAPCTPTQMTFTKGSGTIIFQPTGTKTWTDDNATKQDIGTVSISGGASTPKITLGGSVKASSVTIASSHTLDLNGSNTLSLMGSGTVFTPTGTFTPSTGTVSYEGTSGSNVAGATYYKLNIGGSGTTATYTLAGTTAVTNLLNIATSSGTNTFNASSHTVTLSNSGTPFVIASGETFTPSTSTFVYSNGTSANITATTFYNLSFTGGGTYTLLGSTIASGNVAVTTGTLAGTQDLAVTGNFTGNGTVNLTGGITTLDGTGTFGGSTGWTFSTLTFSSTTTATSTGAIDVTSVMTVSSGNSLNAGSKTWTLSGTTGTPLVVSGTLTAATSTLAFTGNNGAGATTVPSATYYNVTLNNGSETYAGTSPITTNNDLTITAGTFSAPASLTVKGNYSNAGTFTHNSETITFAATTTGKTITPGGSSFYNVIFNGSGGGWSFAAAPTIANDLTMTAGTLSGTSSMTVQGGDITGNGTINLTNGTTTLSGTGSFGGNTAWTFAGLTIGDGTTQTTTGTGSGAITVSTNLTIASNQTLSAGARTWTLSGSGTPMTVSGTVNPGTSTFAYTGSSATNVAGASYYDLNIGGSGTTATYTAAGNLTASGTLTIVSSSGTNTFNGSSRTITLSGSGTPFVINATEVFTEGTSTVDYTGGGATTITADTYYNLGVKPGANSTTHTLGAGTVIVSNAFTAGNGTHTGVTVTANTNNTTLDVTGMTIAANTTFVAHASNSFSIRGDYANNGTFTHSNGVAYVNGTSGQTFSGTMDGSSRFYDLVVANTYADADPESAPSNIYFANSASASGTLTMTTASTTSRFINGSGYNFAFQNINWNGSASSSRVYLRSASPTNQWYLQVHGTQTVQYVDAKDSNASRGNTIVATGGTNVDSGNNVNWSFTSFATTGIVYSHIIDTQVTGGVSPNSIKWKGTLPVGTTVKLQIASSNSTNGPWVFLGRGVAETQCSTTSYYTGDPDEWIIIPASCHLNNRYFRYSVTLETNDTEVTPEVTEVIFNYAR